jgi:transcription elongation factor GreA
MLQITCLTTVALNKLNPEFNKFIGVNRPDNTKQIAEARHKGELSENDESYAAKEIYTLASQHIFYPELSSQNQDLL